MPSDPALHRAAGLFSAGKYDEARAIALDLVAAQPSNFLVLHLLGAIAANSRRPEEALDYETRALALKPDDIEALCNRAIALRMLGRVEEALVDYDRVLAGHPDFVPALSLKGVALAARNRHAEAIASYSKALAIMPTYAPALFNRSLSELVLGDLERGLPDFEWRWKGRDSPIPMRPLGKPQWQGEDPRGRTILVHTEQQGQGDSIQFCRFVPLLAERGARVVFEAPPPLIPLFATLPAELVPMGAPLPSFDLHCPIMSLPLAFGTRLDTIPARVPYLQAPAAHLARWRERLGPSEKPRVVIVWSGNPRQPNDRNRSMPLTLAKSLANPAWDLIAVQKDVRDSDRAELDAGWVRWVGPEIADFADTAAIVELADLVVSVDTSVAHVAGALAKPLWVLLTFAPDWRWFLEREDCPFYPTARLFRQEKPGDWEPVVRRVGQELLSLLK
jgi:hypothetical protein